MKHRGTLSLPLQGGLYHTDNTAEPLSEGGELFFHILPSFLRQNGKFFNHCPDISAEDGTVDRSQYFRMTLCEVSCFWI